MKVWPEDSTNEEGQHAQRDKRSDQYAAALDGHVEPAVKHFQHGGAVFSIKSTAMRIPIQVNMIDVKAPTTRPMVVNTPVKNARKTEKMKDEDRRAGVLSEQEGHVTLRDRVGNLDYLRHDILGCRLGLGILLG